MESVWIALKVTVFAGRPSGSAVGSRFLPSEPTTGFYRSGPASPRGTDTRLDGEGFPTGVLTGLAIAVDNLPEGLATFFSALRDPEVGAAISVASALHHIPAGTSGLDGGVGREPGVA